MKKFFRYFLISFGTLILIALIVVAVTFPPVMAGMAAKTMCSCVYVTGRTPESVRQQELQVFPGLSGSDIEVNNADSTVSASIFWKTSKAIYRKGVGCTLLAEASEAEVRARQPKIAGAPVLKQDSLAWPSGNITTDSAVAGVDYDAVNRAIDHAFVNTDPKSPIFTHAVVAVYDGRIIGERYAGGFTRDSRLMGWSMTKSITNALVGILVKAGKLSVDAPAPVAEWQNDERKSITLNNLLQASSGLAWSETYFTPWAEFHQMFIHSDDKAAYAAARPLKHEPGTFFQYSSGTTNILSRIVRQTVGDDQYYRFPYEQLFYKIGMNQAIIEADASGTFVGSSYSYASARDWARFGLLYLNDGVWNGERILPEGWVKYSITPAPAAPLREYGAQIWLNLGDPKDPTKVDRPGLPNETILFDGFERNYVVIIPSKKLVVVRLGVTHNKNFSLPDLVNGVIAALPK
jgi:CubicO group peptidase (beta-lactamase class C family)